MAKAKKKRFRVSEIWVPFIFHEQRYYYFFNFNNVTNQVSGQLWTPPDFSVDYVCTQNSQKKSIKTCKWTTPLTHENGFNLPDVSCNVNIENGYQDPSFNLTNPTCTEGLFKNHKRWRKFDHTVDLAFAKTSSWALIAGQTGLCLFSCLSVFLLPPSCITPRVVTSLLMVWLYLMGIKLVSERRNSFLSAVSLYQLINQFVSALCLQVAWTVWSCLIGYSKLWLWSHWLTKVGEQSTSLQELGYRMSELFWIPIESFGGQASSHQSKSESESGEQSVEYETKSLVPLLDRLMGVVFVIAFVAINSA